MRDWSKILAETVFSGHDEDGRRFLPEFLQDYEKLTNETVNAGCKKCLSQYYKKITKHFNSMKTDTKNSGFKLKEKFNGIQLRFGSRTIISNRNLTDKQAVELIENHPHGKKLFDAMPKDIDKLLNKAKAKTEAEAKAEADAKADAKAEPKAEPKTK